MLVNRAVPGAAHEQLTDVLREEGLGIEDLVVTECEEAGAVVELKNFNVCPRCVVAAMMPVVDVRCMAASSDTRCRAHWHHLTHGVDAPASVEDTASA